VAQIFGEAKGKLTYNVSPEAILEVALSQTRQKILEISPGS
jgi:DNA polymerase III subunit delta'